MTSIDISSQTHSSKFSPNPQTTKQSMFADASPKLTFIMGIVSSVAVISLVGFVFAASYGLSGRLSANTETSGGVATPLGVPSPSQTSTPPSKVEVTTKLDDHIRGPQDAKVTLVEYSDLECPFCKRFHPDMRQLMQEFSGKVRWVYRHFPLSFHQNAQKEAEATECANKLGGNEAFWAYVDKIFERTTSNGTGFALTNLPKLASELGLNEGKFKTCLDDGEFAAHVQQDLQEGTTFGVSGTPTTFVNGQPVEGAVPYTQLKQVVESLLK